MRPKFRYNGRPRAVRFLARPNRFLAVVRPERSGRPFRAHLPNPGRMEELLLPGETHGFVVPAAGQGRSTRCDLVSVRHGRTLVGVDPRASNALVRSALEIGALLDFGVGPWSAEVRYRDSRIDFGILDRSGRPSALLEVKSSNLRVGRVALFPDAPSVRASRQVDDLRAAHQHGIRTGVLFVIQRNDVAAFDVNRVLDPEFDRAVALARRAGTRIAAVTIKVTPDGLTWGLSYPKTVIEDRPPAEGCTPPRSPRP